MELEQVLKSRRSVRLYQSKAIPEDIIKKLIDAARLAPSGNNAQPWRYKVISDQETKDLLKKNEIIKDQWVYNAPTIIVCSADPSAYPRYIPEWDAPNEVRALRDLSIASEHIVLRAIDLGLGTCYCGWIKKDEIKGLLAIPKEFIVPYIITVGYPKKAIPERQKNELKDILLK